jgi:GAG-pre-integrase domain
LRLAHLNFGALKQAAKDGVVQGLQLSKSDLGQMYSCESCEAAKAKRMSCKNTHPYRAQVPLERVHIDKGGPITPPTFSGKAYYELFVDEASRYKWLFLLKSKSETLANFKVYVELTLATS